MVFTVLGCKGFGINVLGVGNARAHWSAIGILLWDLLRSPIFWLETFQIKTSGSPTKQVLQDRGGETSNFFFVPPHVFAIFLMENLAETRRGPLNTNSTGQGPGDLQNYVISLFVFVPPQVWAWFSSQSLVV